MVAADSSAVQSENKGRRLPDAPLKLPAGHAAQAPAEAPPQPIRYWPATQDAAVHVVQTDAPANATTEGSQKPNCRHRIGL
jgi:hypothetical protein